MGKTLFVAQLPWSITDGQLADMFRPFGVVVSAQVIIDRVTERSKGFGFVEMGTMEEAQTAITGTNGTDCLGRKLVVNEAREKTPRERR